MTLRAIYFVHEALLEHYMTTCSGNVRGLGLGQPMARGEVIHWRFFGQYKDQRRYRPKIACFFKSHQ